METASKLSMKRGNNMKRRTKLVMAGLTIFTMIMTGGCQKQLSDEQEEITIFAASSLTESVTDIGSVFEQNYENKTVNLNFAGSKTLRSQLENGAQADIFISADKKHYSALLDQGILKEGREILTNEMVLAVSKDAAGRIKSMEDLQNDCKLILAEAGVPAGDYSRKIIADLKGAYGDSYEEKVLGNLVSAESNVRQVLTKVVLGEGDAAIVYRTDITQDVADKVAVVEIPAEYNVKASYWIAMVNNESVSESVNRCYEFFSENESREIFESYGFSVSE